MSRQLSQKPNLEYLKKQAKELLRGMRQGGRLAPSPAQVGGFMAPGNANEIARIYYDLTQVMAANRSFTLPD